MQQSTFSDGTSAQGSSLLQLVWGVIPPNGITIAAVEIFLVTATVAMATVCLAHHTAPTRRSHSHITPPFPPICTHTHTYKHLLLQLQVTRGQVFSTYPSLLPPVEKVFHFKTERQQCMTTREKRVQLRYKTETTGTATKHYRDQRPFGERRETQIQRWRHTVKEAMTKTNLTYCRRQQRWILVPAGEQEKAMDYHRTTMYKCMHTRYLISIRETYCVLGSLAAF